MKRTLLAAAGLFLALSGVRAQTPIGITTPVAHRSSTLVGSNVVHQGETIGKVTEFILNDNGCIDYLVISYGGGFIPVPWSAAQVNYELRGVTFRNANVPKANLQALVFTTTWPNFTDTVVLQRLRDVWGATAVPNTTPAPRPVESNLILTPPDPLRPGYNPGDGLPRPRDTLPPTPITPSTPRTPVPVTPVPVTPVPGNVVP